MSEWLTTGQMIDRLKVGEVAIPDQKEYLAVKRTEKGFIWVDRNTYEQSKIHQSYFRVDCFTVNIKWRILPRYVSFEEAMKALADGKKVSVLIEGNKIPLVIEKDSFVRFFSGRKWIDLINGKWTIEE
jgi:hypothetical protein